MSIEFMMPSNHLILCCPFSSCPASGSFPRVGSSYQVAKVLGLQLSICPSTEYTGMISVWSPCCPRDSQESSPVPQFRSINSSALSLLYDPNLTSIHDYWKTIALTIWTFFGKVMSLLLNMLSRFIIAFLLRGQVPCFHDCSHCPQWFWSPRK